MTPFAAALGAHASARTRMVVIVRTPVPLTPPSTASMRCTEGALHLFVRRVAPGERAAQIGRHRGGVEVDLVPGVSDDDKSVHPQHEIAPAIAVHLRARGMSVAAIQLDHDALPAPHRVDRETVQTSVDLGEWGVVALAYLEQGSDLPTAASAWELRHVVGQRASQHRAARPPRR